MKDTRHCNHGVGDDNVKLELNSLNDVFAKNEYCNLLQLDTPPTAFSIVLIALNLVIGSFTEYSSLQLESIE